MKNQVAMGESVNVLAPSGGFVSGTAYLIGSCFGVAAYTCAVGVQGVLHLTGIWSLPKNITETFVFGDKLYWDTVNFNLTKTAGALKCVGFAADPVPVATTALVNIRLNGTLASVLA